MEPGEHVGGCQLGLGRLGLAGQLAEPRAGEVREGLRQVRVQALTSGLQWDAVPPDYQIFDFTCALDRMTMSTMARSKKLVVV